MVLAPKTYTFLCGCFAALGSILFGYDLGIIASVLPSPNFLRTTNYPNSNFLGFIVSSLLLGAFVGCIPSSYIADKWGRRIGIIVGGLIFILGGSLQAGASNQGMVMAGRFFAGVGIGMLSFLAPLYQSEIAHPSIRGRLTTLQQFFLGIGAFIASFVGYGCYNNYPDTQFQWRFPLALQLVPAVPLVALIYLFPESPRYLIKVGRVDEAAASLARLHAHGNVEDIFVVTELHDLQLAEEEEVLLSKGAFRQIFTIPSNFRRVMLGIALQFSVQMTGVSAIQYYSVDIFAAIGFDASKTLLLQSINSVIGLIGEAACVMFIDRLGRRWPLIIANILSSVTFCVATAIQALYPADPTAEHNNLSAGWAFVIMTWIFNFVFSAGIGPLSWAIPVEMLNTGIRARGTALTSMAAWIANFMIAQITPHAFANIGWKYYLVFAICGYTNALFFYLFQPETKGRKLEEMDDYFNNTHWIVPLAKYENISATAREDDLRHGVTIRGKLSPGELEKGSAGEIEKGSAEQSHVEYSESR